MIVTNRAVSFPFFFLGSWKLQNIRTWELKKNESDSLELSHEFQLNAQIKNSSFNSTHDSNLKISLFLIPMNENIK